MTYANLHELPSTKSRKVGRLLKGQRAVSLETRGDDWVRVQYVGHAALSAWLLTVSKPGGTQSIAVHLGDSDSKQQSQSPNRFSPSRLLSARAVRWAGKKRGLSKAEAENV